MTWQFPIVIASARLIDTESLVMTPTAIINIVKDEALKTPSEKIPQANIHEDDEDGEDEVGEDGFATGECCIYQQLNARVER